MNEKSRLYVYVAFICEPMLLVSATRTAQPSVRPAIQALNSAHTK